MCCTLSWLVLNFRFTNSTLHCFDSCITEMSCPDLCPSHSQVTLEVCLQVTYKVAISNRVFDTIRLWFTVEEQLKFMVVWKQFMDVVNIQKPNIRIYTTITINCNHTIVNHNLGMSKTVLLIAALYVTWRLVSWLNNIAT